MTQNPKPNMQTSENITPITPLRNLNLTDDFLFSAATEDLEACKIIIELSLGITIKKIQWKEGQKVVRNLPGKRGIRLDFYVEDIDGKLFNVEMQKRNEGNLPKRTRFYQGLVDAPLLKSGERGFDKLNPLYIVVICDFDLFDHGNYRYTFTNRCHEVEGLELGDESTKIFLNTKGKKKALVDQTLVDFLNYVQSSNDEMLPAECDERLIHLHKIVTQIKSSELMEVEYMKMEERDRLIREDGIALGLAKGRADYIKYHRNKGYSDADICTMLQEIFNLSLEDAQELLRNN